jgi:hypothetical protein
MVMVVALGRTATFVIVGVDRNPRSLVSKSSH